MTLVFLHGLNTYGDDRLHVGPFSFGEMHDRLAEAFASKDIEFVPVTGLGAGTPETQAALALEFLADRGLLTRAASRDRLLLLGHSTGGLVARALASAPELQGRVRLVLTIGTPHHGTRTADFGLGFGQSHPRLQRLVAAFGYDTLQKHEIFRHFTPEAVAEFNRRFAPIDGIKDIALLCEVERDELSWPLEFYHRAFSLHACGRATPGDGFILSESQRRGEVIGPFGLDHFGELGYFLHLRTAARHRARREFDRLVETIASLAASS